MFLKQPDKNSDYIEYEGIRFEIKRRHVRYFRVEFIGIEPRIITPYGSSVKKILKENIKRIKLKYIKYLKLKKLAEDLQFSFRDNKEFINLVNSHINLFSKELNVKVKEIKFRKMKRMWGNCRSSGVVTLNSKLKNLPEEIIVYIIYHELLHLKVNGGHNKEFKTEIKKKFSNYKKINTELKVFSIKLDESYM